MTWATTIPLTVALLLIPATVQAQFACGTRDSFVGTLGEKYGEIRKGAGLAGPTAIYELWVSEATGTWTILKTYPNGRTCIMAVGDSWHDDPPIAPGDPT